MRGLMTSKTPLTDFLNAKDALLPKGVPTGKHVWNREENKHGFSVLRPSAPRR
jgi:hypothetical protein